MRVRVLFGIDATHLHEHPMLKTESFDKIVFNFPHVGGKMRIEKNRELLKQFFMSAAKSLKSSGSVLVTLCNGQGGTVFDNPQRRWDDSWKVTEMAAHGNFVLNAIEPFVWAHFQNYIVTGYRSLDKSFHCAGALTHIFILSESPTAENIALRNKINIPQWNDDNCSWKDITEIMNVSNKNATNLYSHTYAFDITFSVDEKFNLAEFYTLLYNCAGRIINDIYFVRVYKCPLQKVEKRTYRISYKSDHLPLHRKRIIDIHQNLIAQILEDNLNILVSR
ncbi:ferredoxin-fold anticodon-binding domain-containing protein 1 homolog [Calliopsis andreniformis]|uniref:ferredoxin-fold anticodon-binding domain-containing protein 1 homolog n=1 Tax=Calliopsis andreniformis TaxID=337506 RepID=UPI003FCCAA5F